MHTRHSNQERRHDAIELALAALGWTVSDPVRARRLVDVTGLEPAELRAGAAEPAVLGAVLGFLESHEPDLLACANAIGSEPSALVAARDTLDPHGGPGVPA